ncbi:STAS domain-containing protein [Dactylosporangium matsuzakiense]|uniref:STAS domain-containing protein n=1 Tax=Dactylosporangium matsuzakiense TaxID=53360 RepID=UPI0021C45206|nr:STAS domain-containing protein [Dactylosporangium matsuzakiense]UWZ48004.1 STAS domain-containing protein [Dactylosporangium matsuzakiense]
MATGDDRPGWISVRRRPDGRSVLVVAGGRLERLNRPQLAAALHAAITGGAADVEVDIGRATVIDPAIVRALLDARELAAVRGCRFRVRDPTGLPARVLERTGTRVALCGR